MFGFSRSDGNHAPESLEKLVDRFRFGVRNRLVKLVTVEDSGRQYRFACTTQEEVKRAKTLLAKEEGTCAWLTQTLRHSDVFFDVGANMGLYSILAGHLLRGRGTVFAFEPHLVTFEHLAANVRLNDLEDTVYPVAIALDAAEGLVDFHYRSLGASSSGSQLSKPPTSALRFSERKYACSIDLLVERGWLPTPTVVKIDVDGREREVLEGMAGTLSGAERPRAVQVEIQERDPGRIVQLMKANDYAIASRHLTMDGKRSMAQGCGFDEIVHNAIFQPMPTTSA